MRIFLAISLCCLLSTCHFKRYDYDHGRPAELGIKYIDSVIKIRPKGITIDTPLGIPTAKSKNPGSSPTQESESEHPEPLPDQSPPESPTENLPLPPQAPAPTDQ